MKKFLSFFKIEWINEVWREGSMGAAEQKGYWKLCGGISIILVLIYSVMYFNLFNTYFHLYYLRAGFAAHLVSWVCALGSIFYAWKMPDGEAAGLSGKASTWLMVGLLIAALLFGFGFNLDLRGIES